jgi:(p)ppGpp synthase/HD superfamily hydrolase
VDTKPRQGASLLERALALAVEAHEGQRNAVGGPYVLHPLRVMLRLAGEAERVVAVLHDTVENCADRVTLERLRREGYPEEIIDAIDRLSRRRGESYAAFVERIVPSPLARRVKLADLADNLDLAVLGSTEPEDMAGLRERLLAWRRVKAIEGEGID